MKMIVSDRFVENWSASPISGVSGECAPVVPEMPDVVMFSSLGVRLSRTMTSPEAAQKNSVNHIGGTIRQFIDPFGDSVDARIGQFDIKLHLVVEPVDINFLDF